MADTTAKTIILKGANLVTEEKIANAAITPGHLIELMSTDKVRVHASAGQNARAMFAVEDDLQGRDIATAYSANELVKYVLPRPGDQINAIIADGENIVIGDELESAGDGTLRKHVADIADSTADTIYEKAIVAEAREAIDLSDSSGGDPTSARIAVSII